MQDILVEPFRMILRVDKPNIQHILTEAYSISSLNTPEHERMHRRSQVHSGLAPLSQKMPPVRSHGKSDQHTTCGLIPGALDDAGGCYINGKDAVAIKGISCGETAGLRHDRKIPLLAYAVVHRNTPYVGDKFVRTMWIHLVNYVDRQMR